MNLSRTAGAQPTTTPRHVAGVHPVFSINFVRGRVMPQRLRPWLAGLGIGYVVISAALAIALIGWSVHLRHRRHELLLWSSMGEGMPSSAALERMRADVAALHREAAASLRQIQPLLVRAQRRFPLAGRLAALAKTVPARAWISHLSGDRADRALTIDAVYLVDPEGPDALPITAWMETLRADPSFGHHLKRFEVGTSSRKMQGRAELVMFQLIAQWEGDAAHPTRQRENGPRARAIR